LTWYCNTAEHRHAGYAAHPY